jgi:diguanylate cyclase (GGDEF)-like protein/hemerythrin-like metal-binding protein
MIMTIDSNEHKKLSDSVAESGKGAYALDSTKLLASYDPLTGLPGRDLFFDRMRRELARVRRYEIGFALMILALEGIEGDNDVNDQASVDLAICNVTRLLISTVRDIDTIARMGRNEFAILLDGITSQTEAELVVGKIIRSFSEPIELENGTHLKIGINAGIVLSPHDGDQAEELMVCANRAMREAKKNRGQFGFSKNFQAPPKQPLQPLPASPFGDMNLGISIMDAQHTSMANYIQGIIDSLSNGDKSTKLLKRLELLVELCQLHFQTEEDMIKRHDLPGLEEHHLEHQRRLTHLRTLFGKMNFKEEKLRQLTQETQEWLLGHIRVHDTKLAEQLRSKGVS